MEASARSCIAGEVTDRSEIAVNFRDGGLAIDCHAALLTVLR
jgi:hypothetical protein